MCHTTEAAHNLKPVKMKIKIFIVLTIAIIVSNLVIAQQGESRAGRFSNASPVASCGP